MWEVQMVLLSKGESGGKGAGHHLQKNGVPLSRMGWHLLPPLESMKVKVLVTQSCPNLLWPHGLWPARLLCPWNFPGKCWTFPFPGDLPHPVIESESPSLQGDSLLSEAPGKPRPLPDSPIRTSWCETIHNGGYYGAWQSWVVLCNGSLAKCNCFKSWKHRNNG